MGTARQSIWDGILRAAKTEPRDPLPISGASGIKHAITGLGVDDKRGRLLLVSADHDARSAAFMQADIQATFGENLKVIVLRAVTVDAMQVMNFATYRNKRISSRQKYEIFPPSFHTSFYKRDRIVRRLRNEFTPFQTPYNIPVDIHVLQFLHQMVMLRDFLYTELTYDAPDSEIEEYHDPVHFSPTHMDERLGICPVPLYKFDASAIDKLCCSTIEEARNLLEEFGIMQYIFPSADQVALGLIEKGLSKRSAIENQLEVLPSTGHPLATNELVPETDQLTHVLDALKSKGYIGEAEFGLELMEKGKKV